MSEVGVDSTNLNALGTMFLIAMGVLTCALPREKAVYPLLVTVCYMPLGQRLVLAGVHFQVFRVLLLIGWLRVILRSETIPVRITSYDKLFLCWVAVTLIFGTLANPSFDRFISQCGVIYNALGAYFLFRCWMNEPEDLIRICSFLALLIAPLACSMIVEMFTSRNIFSIFGGVPAVSGVRDGRIRCQGAFRHPILAGTYAATLFPLFVGLWFQPSANRLRAAIGAISAVIITGAAASSGALLTLIAGSFGLALWRVRDRMHWVRRGVVLMVIALACVMKAPVWFLIGKVSEIAGGTGWHRSYLIDQAVKHLGEWWLVGSTYTAHWAPGGQVLAADPNNMDITNHYVAEGLGGGVLKLGLFLILITFGFKAVGDWTRSVKGSRPVSHFFVWSMGVCLWSHCVSFISISYFDQLIVMWFWLLAGISMLVSNLHRESKADETTKTTFPLMNGKGTAST